MPVSRSIPQEQRTISRCFVDGSTQVSGNICVVYQSDDIGFAPAISSQSDEPVCVYAESASSNEFDVACYQQGRLIQCCGHGLLAVASALLPLPSNSVLTLIMNGSRIEVQRDSEDKPRLWLSFPWLPEPDLRVTPSYREAIAACLGVPAQGIKAMAAYGGDQGYWVLECHDHVAIEDIVPPSYDLAGVTQRALIVVKKTLDDAVGGVVFRYFAPQYGVIEDVATGSAMRVLAQYFSTASQSLRAQQLSPGGGVLFSRIDSQTIRIGGYVERADT